MPANKKTRPRTKAPETRREELMSAAQKLFLKQGMEATTIEQITAAADVAKGTFYLYFSSKEDVLEALRERFAQQMLERIEAAVAQKKEDDWRGKLSAWSNACLDFYADSIRLHDVLFYGHRPRPTRKGLVNNILIDHLTNLLEAGKDAAVWPINDPSLTAVFLFNGLHGMIEAGRAGETGARRTLEALFLRTAGAKS